MLISLVTQRETQNIPFIFKAMPSVLRGHDPSVAHLVKSSEDERKLQSVKTKLIATCTQVTEVWVLSRRQT